MSSLIPVAMNAALRNVLLHHPHTFHCEIYRKIILRESEKMVAGLPTLGGLGVLDSMDEEDFDYVFVGMGFALPISGFAPVSLVQNDDAALEAENNVCFVIEPEAEPDQPDYFSIKRHDVMYLRLNNDLNPPKLAWEIVSRQSLGNMGGFTRRFICARRDHLHLPGMSA